MFLLPDGARSTLEEHLVSLLIPKGAFRTIEEHLSCFCHRSANVFEVWNTERYNIHFAIVVMQRVVFFAFAVAVV